MEIKSQSLQWRAAEPSNTTIDNTFNASSKGIGSTVNLTASHPYAEVLDSIGKDCTQQVETYVASCCSEQNGE